MTEVNLICGLFFLIELLAWFIFPLFLSALEKTRKKMNNAESDSIYNSIIMYYEERAKKRWQTFWHHPDVRTYIFKFKEQFAHNPFLQITTFVVVASLLTPVLLFIIFAIISAVIAFIGFMMIQVTVLAIGASILSCLLFCIASTFIMMGLS